MIEFVIGFYLLLSIVIYVIFLRYTYKLEKQLKHILNERYINDR